MSWKIDPTHSSVAFSVRHMVVAKVRGRFKEFCAELDIDDRDPTKSTLHAEIGVASIDTGVDQRDQHLRSTDFFDAGQHPKIVFDSKRIEQRGENDFLVHGELTIRGVTRPVTLDVEGGFGKDPWGNRRVMASARASIDRKAFGLEWNQALETGGVLVGDRVELEIDVEAVAGAKAA